MGKYYKIFLTSVFLFAIYSFSPIVPQSQAVCSGGSCIQAPGGQCSAGFVQRSDSSCNTPPNNTGAACCPIAPPPPPPPPPPGPPPPSGGSTCNGTCRNNSNCGVTGEVAGSGTCTSGICCVTSSGGGGGPGYACTVTVTGTTTTVGGNSTVRGRVCSAQSNIREVVFTLPATNTVATWTPTAALGAANYRINTCCGFSGGSCRDFSAPVYGRASGTTSFTFRGVNDDGEYCIASASIGVTGTVPPPPPPPPPPAAPIVNLTANPTSVTSGGSSTLNWSTSNATSCTASNGWTGTKAISGSQSTGPLTAARTYTLTCTGPGGSANRSVTVSVGAAPPPPPPPPGAPTVNLTANPTTVTSGASSTLSWSSTNATSCTASGGWTGTKALSGSQSTGPLTAGRTFTLTCTGAGGSTNRSVTVNVTVVTPPPPPPPPPGAPIVDLRANGSGGPISVVTGTSVTLSWTAANATSCTASASVATAGWSGSKAISGSQASGSLTSSRNFTLTCTGAGGTSSDTVTVNTTVVPPPPPPPPSAPTVDLRANGSNGPVSITSGQSVTLSWSTTLATSCTASASVATAGWSGSKAISGSQASGSLTTSRNFTLNCTGSGGSGTDTVSVNITVLPPPPPPPPPPSAPTVDLRANGLGSSATIASGASANLSWTSTNATSCTASNGWTGTKTVSGSQSTGPLTTTRTYVLTCTGPGGTGSDSVVVNIAVAPPPPPPAIPTVDLRVNGSNGPVTVPNPGSATLTWSSTNASSCTASGSWGGARATSGSFTITGINSSRNFTLTCTGSGGSASDTVTVNVVGLPPLPIVDLRFNGSGGPVTIASGASGTISWTAANSTSCTASASVATAGWSGSKTLSGSQSSGAITSSRNFTLTCTGSGGTSSDTVVVNVTASGAPTVDLRANGSSGSATIPSGTAASLTWSSTNSTSCTASGGWSGSKTISGSQSSGILVTTTTYTLTCTGPGGSGVDTVTVNIGAGGGACAPARPRDPPTAFCSPSGGPEPITWSWDAVPGANQYDVDILNSAGTVVVSNVFQPATNFGPTCATGGICSLTTSHAPGVSVRSRIVALGLACSASTPAFSQFVAVGPCASCSITLSPDPLTVNTGLTAQMVANVSISPSGSTTASAVSFSSSNPAVATASTPDSSLPFISTITGVSIGTSTVDATATLANGGSCTTAPVNVAVVNVTPPGPWWHVTNGDVTTNSNIEAFVPATCSLSVGCDFMVDNPSGSPISSGVVVYGGTADFDPGPGSGQASANPNWNSNTRHQVLPYNWALIQSLLPASTVRNIIGPGNYTGNLNSGALSPDGFNYCISNGPLTLNGAQNINTKTVLIVNGDLTINERINIANPSNDFFMAIVNGNINVSPTLNNIPPEPHLQGIFMAEGSFNTGNGSNTLLIHGSVAGLGGVNLERDLGANNVTTPGEEFEYDPRLFLNFPESLIRNSVIWREVAP